MIRDQNPYPTTQRRHKKIFDRYIELLKFEHNLDSEKALSLNKSYFYNKLAKEFCMTPGRIGRIIQLQLHASGSPPSTNKRVINIRDMDPQVREILGL